jgi:hypothetical protein
LAGENLRKIHSGSRFFCGFVVFYSMPLQYLILIDGAEVEQVESFKFLCVQINKLNIVQAHQNSCEEGTTNPFPPQETEKIWHGFSDPQNVIQLHHREHPDWGPSF